MLQGDQKAALAFFSSISAGFVSLGFMFAWVTFGTSPTDTSLSLDGMLRPLHAIVLQIISGCTFLALAWSGLSRLKGMRAIHIGLLLGVASVVLRWCSGFAGPIAVIVGGALAGIAYALYLSGWLSRYYVYGPALLVVMLFASFIGDTVYLWALYLGPVPSKVILMLLPVLAVAVLHAPRADLPISQIKPIPTPSVNKPASARTYATGKINISFALQLTSLLLCNFASGPASYVNAADGDLHIVATVMFVLALFFTLYGQPRYEVIFTIFSIATILCIAPMLALDQSPIWLGGLLTGCFWALLLYSIAWFALNDISYGVCPSSLSFICLGSIYLLSGLAKILGLILTNQIACILALVLVGIALALAFVRATFYADQTTVSEGKTHKQQESMPATPETSLVAAQTNMGHACRVIGERYGLTPSELSVCEYLARGYSLRQVAAELHISEGAAKYHRHNVYQKCGVSNRQELINLAETATDNEKLL